MTVSLLVGTVRALVHYAQRPGEILAAMNQRMLGPSQGGFTTCLILRIDPHGALTAANAGHLAPYVDGVEFQLENGSRVRPQNRGTLFTILLPGDLPGDK